jgi:hypothetical protein
MRLNESVDDESMELLSNTSATSSTPGPSFRQETQSSRAKRVTSPSKQFMQSRSPMKQAPPASSPRISTSNQQQHFQFHPYTNSNRILASVRMRPLNAYRPGESLCDHISLNVKGHLVCVRYKNKDNENHYKFDNVFGPDASQSTVYQNVVLPLITDVPNGISTCVIA